MGPAPAQNEHSTVEYFINVLETEAAILFKQVELDFLTNLPPFREDPRGRDKVHKAPIISPVPDDPKVVRVFASTQMSRPDSV